MPGTKKKNALWDNDLALYKVASSRTWTGTKARGGAFLLAMLMLLVPISGPNAHAASHDTTKKGLDGL